MTFQKAHRMVKSGKLNIYPIISPPRTGSTMMAGSIYMNSKIDSYCHEPFFDLKYNPNDTDAPYDTITRKEGNIVLKEMSHWLDINDEYKRFFELIERPVILLIRDPALSMESKIRKVIQTFSMREKESLREHLCTICSGNDQTELLEKYASIYGHNSWEDMVSAANKYRDYREFENILSNDQIFSLSGSGWHALDKQRKYLAVESMPFKIIDSYEHRSHPVETTREICDMWNLVFDNKMIRWGQGNMKLDTGQCSPHQRIWYESILNSSGIMPPFERSLETWRFPAFVKEHIDGECYPVYNSMIPIRDKIHETVV